MDHSENEIEKRGSRALRRFGVALLAGLMGLPAASGLAFVEREDHTHVATRADTPGEQIGSSVTVIRREELQKRQIRFVSDALRGIPGLAVSRSGGQGALTQVRIRGAEANHTLVLIDGIEVNDPSFSEFDLSNLRTGDIERIEIVRGPQSVLYGSEASAGVIQIITRQAEAGVHASGRVEVGTQATRSGLIHAEAGGEQASLSLNAQGTWTNGSSQAAQNNGNVENDAFREYVLSGRWEFHPWDHFGLDGSIRKTHSRVELDGFDFFSSLPADAAEHTEIDQLYGIANARVHAFDRRLETRVSLALTDSDRENGGSGTFGSRVDSRSQGNRVKFEWQNSFAINDRNRLTLGAESEREKADNGVTVLGKRVWTVGYYAQYEVSPLEHLFLTAGLRLDDNQTFGTVPTYRVTGAYQFPDSGTRLTATWGTGFTSPTMDERFFQSPFFVGNPDLDPESSQGFDFGVEQKLFQDHALLAVTYFENRIRNLIVPVPAPFPSPWTAQNLDQANARGVEVGVLLRPIPYLEVQGSYTFTRTRSAISHRRLLRRPTHIASLVADYRIGDRGTLDLAVQFNGRQDDFGSGVDPIQLDAYTVVNLGGAWAWSQTIKFFGRIENLFAADYEEVSGDGSAPRSALAGVEVRF